jgi:lipopolysaccharide export system permease protein
MFLFLLQFIMKFADELVGKGLSAWVIMELVTLNLAWMVVLAVPMSVLVATLMAFGDLSSRNETTAMKASGMSLYRMLTPALATGLLLALGLVYFNNFILPDANHRLKTLTMDVRRKKPTLALVNGVFSQEIGGYSILVRKTVPNSNDIEGVTIYDYTDPTQNVTITAVNGTISFSADYRKLIMDLHNGEIHQLDLQDSQKYRRLRFEHHRLAMSVGGFGFERSSEDAVSRSDREMSSAAMRVVVDSLTKIKEKAFREFQTAMTKEAEARLSGRLDTLDPSTHVIPGGVYGESPMLAVQQTKNALTLFQFRLVDLERRIDQFQVEIDKKYSIPAACIVFVLIGVPLGIMARKGGFGVAASLSLGFFVLYWACLIGGEKLADRDIIQPGVAMWIANVIIGAAGVLLTIRIARETIVIDFSFFSRLIPRRWRNGSASPGGRS